MDPSQIAGLKAVVIVAVDPLKVLELDRSLQDICDELTDQLDSSNELNAAHALAKIAFIRGQFAGVVRDAKRACEDQKDRQHVMDSMANEIVRSMRSRMPPESAMPPFEPEGPPSSSKILFGDQGEAHAESQPPSHLQGGAPRIDGD